MPIFGFRMKGVVAAIADQDEALEGIVVIVETGDAGSGDGYLLERVMASDLATIDLVVPEIIGYAMAQVGADPSLGQPTEK